VSWAQERAVKRNSDSTNLQELSMHTSKLHKTLPAHSPVFADASWFSVHRLSDGADGVRRVGVVTRHPNQHRFLTSHPLHENERYEVFPGVFITVRDASEQSRVKVLIEAPRSVTIRHESYVELPSESNLLRRVQLPVSGAMYLHSMPGRQRGDNWMKISPRFRYSLEPTQSFEVEYGQASVTYTHESNAFESPQCLIDALSRKTDQMRELFL
jgi:hypothetical protein